MQPMREPGSSLDGFIPSGRDACGTVSRVRASRGDMQQGMEKGRRGSMNWQKVRIERGKDEEWNPTDNWQVSLGHQCDGWSITDPRYKSYGLGVPHERALEELRAFIATLCAAEAHLIRREELNA